ncbi:alpha/beta hydrolase [Kitasatospora cinereorecta]|uniref:Alpha/beta fold hydrolase n=1 Tax=Kitasatospora cinereorecta TaxID=285560 RepID=A0ABW0VI78_9ACTN
MTTDSTDASTPAAPADAELAASLAGDFRSAYATVDGLKLHYVAGGEGRPLLLLPGWPQTWWEFRKVMPALAAAGRRVIAVDLPGMGASDKPADGYDKKAMAQVIHGLVRELGYEQVDIAGHDVGSQVAFAFAANFPQATGRIAMLDVLHPDASLYQIPIIPAPGMPFFPWWFAFNQVPGLPEQLLTGRAEVLVDWIFDNFLLDRTAVNELDRAVYARALTSDGVRGGNGWYQAFGQDIVDLGTYGKIGAPVLGMVSNLADGMFAAQMQGTLPGQASDVRVVVVPDAGHYFVEEAPQAVIDEFTRFFA